MSMKAPDYYAIPLCDSHHQHGPEAIHQNGTKVWQARFGQEMDLARQTQAILKDKILIPEQYRLKSQVDENN